MPDGSSPISASRFSISIDGVQVGGFDELAIGDAAGSPGRKLQAHELAHVVQQQQAARRLPGRTKYSNITLKRGYISQSAMLGLKAAAMRVPFIPTRVGLGTDVLRCNPAIKLVDSPYDDRQWVAMPALPLDAALLHVDRADARGVCQVKGPDLYMDDLFARAAKKTFVSCDELVDSAHFAQGDEARFVHWERAQTTGVVHLPGGAHPSSCAPLYGFDLKHFKEYAASAKEPGGWQQYAERYVACTEQEYLERVGGLEAVRRLPLPVF